MEQQLLRTVRLYERIAEAIRGQVVAGKLKEGDRLPNERELGEAFGVSRPVVREAIRALTKDGLVWVRQGSGTFIANGTNAALGDSLGLVLSVGAAPKNLNDLVEIREILEPSIACLAARRAESADLAAMQAAIDRMDASSADVDAFIAADHEFHLAIATATHNPLAPTLLYPIVDKLNEQRKTIFFVVHSAQSAQRYHRRIYKAVAEHDEVAAGEAMRLHLAQVNKDIAKLPGGRRAAPGSTSPAETPKGRRRRPKGGDK
jgi:GntR family transcriptional repressor for pyruvate dehydrogenase complex